MSDDDDLSETDRVRRARARLQPPLPGFPDPPLEMVADDDEPWVAKLDARALVDRARWASLHPEHWHGKSHADLLTAIADALDDALKAPPDPHKPRTRPGARKPRPKSHRVDRERLRDLYEAKGLNPFAISKKLAAEGIVISDVGVRKALNRMGIFDGSNGRPSIAPEKADEIVRLYVDEQLSSYQVAKRVGVDPSTVKRYLGLRNVAMRDRHARPLQKTGEGSAVAAKRPAATPGPSRVMQGTSRASRSDAKPRAKPAAPSKTLPETTEPSERSRSDAQFGEGATHLSAGPRPFAVAPAAPPCDADPRAARSARRVGASETAPGPPGRRTSLLDLHRKHASGPTIPESTLRFARRFDAARDKLTGRRCWSIKDIAWLFDVEPDSLRAALED